jgi:hypothetical protein
LEDGKADRDDNLSGENLPSSQLRRYTLPRSASVLSARVTKRQSFRHSNIIEQSIAVAGLDLTCRTSVVQHLILIVKPRQARCLILLTSFPFTFMERTFPPFPFLLPTSLNNYRWVIISGLFFAILVFLRFTLVPAHLNFCATFTLMLIIFSLSFLLT